MSSSDVNSYLYEVSGEQLTAKDFRTWWGSVLALRHLRIQCHGRTEESAQRQIGQAVARTAEALGHTEAVFRSIYMHQEVISACENGTLSELLIRYDALAYSDLPELTRDEKLAYSRYCQRSPTESRFAGRSRVSVSI